MSNQNPPSESEPSPRVPKAGDSLDGMVRHISRRYTCTECGAKGRHNKQNRGAEPICPACKNRKEYMEDAEETELDRKWNELPEDVRYEMCRDSFNIGFRLGVLSNDQSDRMAGVTGGIQK